MLDGLPRSGIDDKPAPRSRGVAKPTLPCRHRAIVRQEKSANWLGAEDGVKNARRSAVGDHHRFAGHGGQTGARSLLRIPPEPKGERLPPALSRMSVSIAGTVVSSAAAGSLLGSEEYRPSTTVSKISSGACNRLVTHRGQVIVIAETDLGHADGVVLIDNGKTTILEKCQNGVAGVEIATATVEIAGGEQNLSSGDAVMSQTVFISAA